VFNSNWLLSVGVIAAVWIADLAATPPSRPPAFSAAVADVSVAAKPGSFCHLDPSEIPKGRSNIIIPTDSSGNAHVRVQASSADEKKGITVILVCTDTTSKTTKLTGHVVASDYRMPNASPQAIALAKPTSTIGVLSKERVDVTTASDATLKQFGYPARPDRLEAPSAYAAWLYAATTPGVFVKIPPVRLPTAHNFPKTSTPTRGVLPKGGAAPHVSGTVTATPNWSGFEITSLPVTVSIVYAYWVMPTVILPWPPMDTASSQWVGIDGDARTDLIQDGTVNESVVSLCGGNGPFDPPIICTVSSYFGFYEYFPDQQYAINGFYVAPGDTIESAAWVTGPPTKVVGHFLVYNVTRKEVTENSEAAPAGLPPALLNQVEWIVERPIEFVNNEYAPLAQYTSTALFDATFTLAGGQPLFYNSPNQNTPILDYIMTRNGGLGETLLSECGPTTLGRLTCFWHNYQ
jgi:hypothetical protein